ncbi:catalase [Sesbania bispinosa]|nr:catalase [Sesbania bispinosa]
MAGVACEGGLTDDGRDGEARNGQGYREVVSTLWGSGAIRGGTGNQMRQRCKSCCPGVTARSGRQ